MGHLQTSAIKDYMINKHHDNLTIKQLEENVKIMKHISCPKIMVINRKCYQYLREEKFFNILKLFV